MITGCDISRWQDSNSTAQMVDFEKMKAAGAEFVFIKASQANYMDEDIVLNWNNAKASEILRGAYHFLTWNIAPETQADYFCNLIDHDPGELPPVCDYEWWATTPADADTILRKFCERVEKNLQRTPIIYTAPGFWTPNGTSEAYWAHYPLWVANWNVNTPLVPRPWSNWTFWQYSSKGDGPKYGCESLNVDMDNFNGSLADLYRFCGLTPPTVADDHNTIYAELGALRAEVDRLTAWAEAFGKKN